MKSVSAVVVAAGVALGAEDECKYAVEVLHLQDLSASFADSIAEMVTIAPQIMGNLTQAYPGAEMALCGFTDKPIPGTGYGNYGLYWWYMNDVCFTDIMNWTGDATAYGTALSSLYTGSGLDFAEGQLEALYQAAVGGSFATDQYDSTGRPYARVVMQITDAPPHMSGDMLNSVNWWNSPRVWDPVKNESSGGCYSDTWAMNISSYDLWLDVDAAYFNTTMRPIIYKMDHGITLTSDEEATYKKLNRGLGGLGPLPYPQPLPHPDDGSCDCATVEYPTVAQVGAVLNKYQVVPVMLIADPTEQYGWSMNQTYCPGQIINNNATERQECIKSVYSSLFETMGVPYSIQLLSSSAENIVDVMLTAIGEIVSELCLTTTTPAPDSTAVPIPVVVPTGAAGASTGATVATGGNGGGSTAGAYTGVDGSTTTAVFTGLPGSTTTAMFTGLPDSTTTAGAGSAMAAGGGGGSSGASTTVIAAAAAGGVAALAAGILAYKKMGLGALGGNKAQALQAAGQVDVPEEAMDREAVEEITMDMFR